MQDFARQERGLFFDASGTVGACKPKVLDALLLDGGGQCAIIPFIRRYLIIIGVK